MENFLWMLSGTVLGAYIGAVINRREQFHSLVSRAVEAFADATATPAIDNHFNNARWLSERFFGVETALVMAGHTNAAKELLAILREVNALLEDVKMNPRGVGHSAILRFRIDAWAVLAERHDLVRRLTELKPNRGALFELHW